MPTYAGTRAGYRHLWDKMHVTREAEASSAADGILRDRTRYEAVEARTGVPWFWIALVHLRESSRDFRGVLHNGQKIIGTGKLTTLVPKGRGPFETWEEAAVDALTYMGLDKIDDWPLERCLHAFERYNGWGYFGKINSPYVWAGTNLYSRGKYVADGKYDPNHVDKQLGLAAVLKILTELSDDIADSLDMGAASPVEPEEKSTMLESAKALVAAAVSFVASLIAANLGFDVPLEFQTYIVSFLVGILTGAFAWLVPNANFVRRT